MARPLTHLTHGISTRRPFHRDGGAGIIGTGSQGLVTLTPDALDPTHKIDVVVSLGDGVLMVNSGGPHTPFVFNLASAVAGSKVTITSVNFEAATGSQPATPYGDFTNGIAYNGQNGGGHGSHGPLEFFVFNANGITISDFVTNSGILLRGGFVWHWRERW
jgi:hypothetical protein